MSKQGGGGGGATAPTESTQLLSSPSAAQSYNNAIAQPHHRLTHTVHNHGGQPHEAEAAVDPVEMLVKRALTGTAAILFLVFLGVLALVLKALGFDRLPVLARLPPALHSYWAVFAPFWLADAVLLALVAQVLHGIFTLRATTREEKRHMARCVAAE